MAAGAALYQASASASPIEAFTGMCDASAVLTLNEDLFIVADDEDCLLRIYSRQKAGSAIFRTNLAPFLRLPLYSEADIEGSARIGDMVYWITSHGNNRKGKERKNRQRFFAVKVNIAGAVSIQPQGHPYLRLLDDLLDEPQFAHLNLAAAAKLPPNTPGSLNIEGLAATPNGHLLIAFKSPVPRRHALIVPLLNPLEVIEGKRPKFGEPRLIDLGGNGIRSMEQWPGGYVILDGSADGKTKSRLYEWNGIDPPRLLPNADIADINPEAISLMTHGSNSELFVVSDDGTRLINAEECKKLKDPTQRTFRAVTLPLRIHAAPPP